MIKYRSDIDGLRAIAVLSVVIFHAFPTLLVGGFVGVDIFFVISGYLISSILIKDIKNSDFSFITFYKKRILRILPALILVILFCYWVGWQTLFPSEFSSLGKHIAGGSGFSSNLLLWSESGYFDVSSALKPLLHLWSLGIEEQYYLVWPVILIISFRFGKGFLKPAFILLTISLVYSVLTMHSDSTANYYSPLSRFWELMAGSVLAILNSEHSKFNEHSKKYKNLISLSGFIFIAISIFVINERMPFPGYIAIIPVLGASLLVAAGNDAFINKYILSSRPLVLMGIISYPMYLWHWPLMSFLRIWMGRQPSDVFMFSCVLLSIVLAYLTYACVEKPIRFGKFKGVAAVPLAAAIATVFVIGVFTYKSNGFPDRFITSINNATDDGRDIWDGGYLENGCFSVDRSVDFANCQKDKRGIAVNALIGDSKAAALLPGLVRTSHEDGRWVSLAGETGHGSPAPIISDDINFKRYQRYIVPAVESVIANDNIKSVALVTATRVLFVLTNSSNLSELESSKFFDTAYDGMSVVVTKLVKANKRVILVIDNPTLPDPKDCTTRTTSSGLVNYLIKSSGATICSISIDQQKKLAEPYFKLLHKIQKSQPEGSVVLFDPYPYLCDEKKSECNMFMNGKRMYGYADHISDYASGRVGGGLNDFISNLK